MQQSNPSKNSMTPEDYVNKAVASNKKLFAAKEIKITPESLKDVIRAAWSDGYTAGNKSNKCFEQLFGKGFGK